ncbi:MAG: hypothetical protein ACLUPG_11130 [Roseburia faecis]
MGERKWEKKDVLERKKVVEGEYVPLGSRLWLGGADCMIATLCNIMTEGGLTFSLSTIMGWMQSGARPVGCCLGFGMR